MVRLTVGHDCAVVWRHKKEGSATRRADDHSFPAEGTKGQFRSLLQNSFCPLASAKPVFLRGLVELGRRRQARTRSERANGRALSRRMPASWRELSCNLRRQRLPFSGPIRKRTVRPHLRLRVLAGISAPARALFADEDWMPADCS